MPLRYGNGVYFSSTSSKSDDYAVGSQRSHHQGGKIRVMFLCKVAAGHSFSALSDGMSQSSVKECLDQGYHSIVGEPKTPELGSLNYDELVVYNEDAAIPSYLIVYHCG